MVKVVKRRTPALYTLLFTLSVFIVPVSAHPHLFIDVMAKFMLTDSTLSGVNVFWDIDEMTSAGLIDEFDLNRNGRFEKKEYTTLEREAFSYAAQSSFFTVVTWADNVLRITETRRFVATILSDKKIRYSFFIPFDIKLTDIVNEKVVMFFNDPSMFVAFDLKKEKIQSGQNSRWAGFITFEKEDYYDLIVLNVKRKPQ